MILTRYFLPLSLLLVTLSVAVASQLLPGAPGVQVEEARWPQTTIVTTEGLSGFAAMLDTHFAEVTEVERAAIPLEGYAIIGVVETEGRNVILVSRDGQVVSLGLGDSIDGFVLVSLSDDEAQFQRRDENVVLGLPY